MVWLPLATKLQMRYALKKARVPTHDGDGKENPLVVARGQTVSRMGVAGGNITFLKSQMVDKPLMAQAWWDVYVPVDIIFQ